MGLVGLLILKRPRSMSTGKCEALGLCTRIPNLVKYPARVSKSSLVS